ncbi:MAG: hypothetical protein JWM31_2761 [Solirubrobacterales bacterium]|nr:hypothetical protein [Solirubrobacterales bacterium]
MHRLHLLTGLLILLVIAAATATATAQTTTTPPPLTPATETALYPVIDYAQILDATKPAPAKISRYTSACRKLTPSNRLIAAYRAVCRAEGDAFTAGLRLPACRSNARCQARLNRYAADLQRQEDASRTFNLALKAVVQDVDCRSALRVNAATLNTVARIRRAAVALVRTIVNGTAAQISQGVARFYSVDRAALADHRGRLDQFRAACR